MGQLKRIRKSSSRFEKGQNWTVKKGGKASTLDHPANPRSTIFRTQKNGNESRVGGKKREDHSQKKPSPNTFLRTKGVWGEPRFMATITRATAIEGEGKKIFKSYSFTRNRKRKFSILSLDIFQGRGGKNSYYEKEKGRRRGLIKLLIQLGKSYII